MEDPHFYLMQSNLSENRPQQRTLASFTDLKKRQFRTILARRQRVIGSRPLVRSATHLERRSSAYIGLTDDPYVG